MCIGRLAILLCLVLSATRLCAQPSEVSRVLRTFDFEERRRGNVEELPMHWDKVEGENLPHYVNGRLSADTSRSGKYSFRFDLNGGSLIYRYEADQIRVVSGAHYRVEGFVRTTPLRNARARMTAYFTDQDMRPIEGSVHHSPLYAASAPGETWHRMAVELSAADPAATHLVIELALLQPAQYAPNTLGQRTLFVQDIRGSAWFDDIAVSQVPRVTMSTDRPGNIFRKGDDLSLQVLVNDRFTDDLAAQLLIRDARGKTIYQQSGALEIASAETIGVGQKKMALTLPQLPPGWYEASLVMTSQGQFVGEQTAHLVLLADEAPFTAPDPRFGIIATDFPFEGWGELPDILPYLGAGRVKLAVWSKDGDIEQMDSGAFDTLLQRLTEIGVTPTACLIDLPPTIAQKLSGSWLQILRGNLDAWQPPLAEMIARHANHLERWQLGADGSEAFVTQTGMRTVYDRIYTEFANLMDQPDLAMPWPAWYEMEGKLPATVALSVPPSVLPSQLPLYMQDIGAREGHNLSLSLQLLDEEQYGRDMQMRDLAQRVVYALAADAQRIDIPLPFTVARSGDTIVRQPRELLMVVRTLITTLGGTTFQGKVPIADGVEAFLFDKDGQGILVLWDRGNESGTRQLALNLGTRPMRMDLWGNVTPMFKPTPAGRAGPTLGASNSVAVDVGPMPIFLIDVDGEMARLRASVAFDRPLLESSFEPHARKIRLTNPYKQAIGGTLKLKAPAGWTLNPPTFTFTLNPGETFERDLTIEFPYNSFAGQKTIEAQFALQGEQDEQFTVPLVLNLGLSDVGMQTIALRDGKDVLVQQMITNYGDKPIDYTAFAIYPGQARQERLVTNLGAGRTTIKLYRFTNVGTGAEKVRVGVKELVGTRILNEEIAIQ